MSEYYGGGSLPSGGYSSRGGRRLETSSDPRNNGNWKDLPCKMHDGKPEFDRVTTNGVDFIVYMDESLRGKHKKTLDRMYEYGGLPKKTAILLEYAMRRGLAKAIYV